MSSSLFEIRLCATGALIDATSLFSLSYTSFWLDLLHLVHIISCILYFGHYTETVSCSFVMHMH